MSATYLTTPIYYANDVPHIGHAYTTIAADALARAARLRGRDVFLLTGTDEHGVNIERVRPPRAVDRPQIHVDGSPRRSSRLWARLDISYDRFVRTTEPAHQRAALALWHRLQAQRRPVPRRPTAATTARAARPSISPTTSSTATARSTPALEQVERGELVLSTLALSGPR